MKRSPERLKAIAQTYLHLVSKKSCGLPLLSTR
jgi:hypothetical protein